VSRQRFDPPDLGTVSPELTSADFVAVEALREHLQQCAVEYLARVNETRPSWTVYRAPGETAGPTDWAVDEAADAGAVILARDPDGLRVEVDVHVAVGAQRTARRGVMPADGWPDDDDSTTEERTA
jgi:hypothetical protein